MQAVLQAESQWLLTSSNLAPSSSADDAAMLQVACQWKGVQPSTEILLEYLTVKQHAD